MTDYPACFSSAKQYSEWKLLAIKSGLQSMSICTDCSQSYQANMVRLRRCESPEANVRVLQMREMDNDTFRDTVAANPEDLVALNDPWSKLLVGLESWGTRPPAPVRFVRIKKEPNEPTV